MSHNRSVFHAKAFESSGSYYDGKKVVGANGRLPTPLTRHRALYYLDIEILPLFFLLITNPLNPLLKNRR